MNRPNLIQGFLAGIAAGLAASLVALAIRAVAGIPTPAESMADPATLVIPPEMFALALSLLEFLAKPALVLGLLTLQVLLAGDRWAQRTSCSAVDSRHRRKLARCRHTDARDFAGAWLAFLPLVGKGLFGSDDPAGAGSHIAGLC